MFLLSAYLMRQYRLRRSNEARPNALDLNISQELDMLTVQLQNSIAYDPTRTLNVPRCRITRTTDDLITSSATSMSKPSRLVRAVAVQGLLFHQQMLLT